MSSSDLGGRGELRRVGRRALEVELRGLDRLAAEHLLRPATWPPRARRRPWRSQQLAAELVLGQRLGVEGRLEVLERQRVVEDREVGLGGPRPWRLGASIPRGHRRRGRQPPNAACATPAGERLVIASSRRRVDRVRRDLDGLILRTRASPLDEAGRGDRFGHLVLGLVRSALGGGWRVAAAPYMIWRTQAAWRASTETIVAAAASVFLVRRVPWPSRRSRPCPRAPSPWPGTSRVLDVSPKSNVGLPIAFEPSAFARNSTARARGRGRRANSSTSAAARCWRPPGRRTRSRYSSSSAKLRISTSCRRRRRARPPATRRRPLRRASAAPGEQRGVRKPARRSRPVSRRAPLADCAVGVHGFEAEAVGHERVPPCLWVVRLASRRWYFTSLRVSVQTSTPHPCEPDSRECRMGYEGGRRREPSPADVASP